MGTGGLDIWVLAGTSRQEYNFLCAIFWILGDVCGKIDADNATELATIGWMHMIVRFGMKFTLQSSQPFDLID